MMIDWFWQLVVFWGQARESLKLALASILPDNRGFLVVTVRCRSLYGGIVKGSLVAQ